MTGETFLLLLRLGVSLSLIFGLMWAAAKVARKPRRGRIADHLEVIERKPLTKNSSIAIVRVGGETLTVGITDNNVSLLGQVDVAVANATGTGDDAVIASDEVAPVDLRAAGSRRSGRSSRDTVVATSSDGRRGVLDVLRDRTVRHIPG